MSDRLFEKPLISAPNLILVAAFGLGAFHLGVVSGIISISTMPLRLIHVAMAFSLLFALRPASEKLRGTRANLVLSVFLIGAVLAASLWLISRWKAIAFSGGLTTDGDFYAGAVIVLLVFEAARRGIGLILALITLVFFCYPFFSPYLPGILHGRGYSLERMVLFLTTDTQGVYGIPIGVAATYIIVFTIFGAMLSRFGAGDFFFEISIRITRGASCGEREIRRAVLHADRNGVRFGSRQCCGDGYRDHSHHETGGLRTAPGRGHRGGGLHRWPTDATGHGGGRLHHGRNRRGSLYQRHGGRDPAGPVVLRFRLLRRSSASGEIGHRTLDHRQVRWTTSPRSVATGRAFHRAFAVLLGLMLAGFSPFKASLWAMGVLIALDVVKCRRIDLDLLRRITGSIAEGSRNVITISAACAAAGIISGTLGITGLGSKIALLIDVAANGQLFLALLFTMIASIILGMGLPTTAAYLILATVVAPALVKFGVPMLTAHFFVFYYGCISTITPPVALASYVAGGIAGADVNKVGWTAASYATTSFVLPFAFVFGPGLLMQGEVLANMLAVITGFIGVGAVAAGVVGCVLTPLSWRDRVLAIAAGLCLLVQFWPSAIIGCLLLGWLAFQQLGNRQVPLKS